ncbi:beta-lactamase/transpeptidase-like protein [Phlegmacium glaucopus]|nr:beta-lactamase/transpeptidase-like protein [Phlegmacium glaucopus]
MTHLIRVCLSFAVVYYVISSGSSQFSFSLRSTSPSVQTSTKNTCHPPPLNLLAYHPPSANDKDTLKAAQRLDQVLAKRVSKSNSGIQVDGLSVAVITSHGPIFERGYGVLRANETGHTGKEQQRPVDRNSIFRIASITKMFTVLETLILRERGALDWDDPVEKYLPDFSPPSYGWAGHLDGLAQNEEKQRVTLRQLASHLGGISRDTPLLDIGDWPTPIPWELSPKTDHLSPTLPEKSYESIMKALSQLPLVNMPNQYPIYSNTGIDLLGLSNVAANKMANPNNAADQPETHKELVKRDIFDPLNLNSSFYRVVDSRLREHIAVPSKDSEWADQDFSDVEDAAGGQYSSLADLGTLMKTFLSPTAQGGLLPVRVIREWLHPLYVWGSTNQQTGAPWEIINFNGVQAYTKGGNLPGYHSIFALIPGSSYGIIVLLTGTFVDTSAIASETAKHFQPVFAKALETQLTRKYVGTWINGADIAEVKLVDGHLYLSKLVIRGVDVLQYVQNQNSLVKKAVPVALWTTGRVGEFRLAFGRHSLNDIPEIGCEPYWISIDFGLSARGAPLDLLYWKNGVLHYPSAGVRFARHRG